MMASTVKVTRAFCLKAERQEVGKLVEVPDGLALELIQAGKAERAGKPAARRGPMTTAASPALVGQVARKE